MISQLTLKMTKLEGAEIDWFAWSIYVQNAIKQKGRA